jgi:hypothetical protein
MTVKERLHSEVDKMTEAQAMTFLQIIEEERQDLLDAEEALQEAREKGTIPWETIKKELNLSL